MIIMDTGEGAKRQRWRYKPNLKLYLKRSIYLSILVCSFLSINILMSILKHTDNVCNYLPTTSAGAGFDTRSIFYAV